MKKTNMKDIARLAGVSIKTVSRVINNSDSVKETTRQKVLRIIEDEGYQVNILAQGLRNKKTNTIIIFIDRHDGGYWSIWHNEIVQEIIRNAKEKGYKTIISPSSGKGCLDDETDGFYLLKSGMADGAIIFDNVRDDIRINYLRENRIPFVVIGRDVLNDDTCYVDLDNYTAGSLGATYLMSKGYKSIAFMLGNQDFVVNQERANGFECIMSGKDNIDYSIIYGIDSIAKAYDEAMTILSNERPEVFFISGDERALGIYKAINELGLSIPEDVAVLGIDNIHISDYVYPPLTTIDQPSSEFGKYSIEILTELLESKTRIVKRVMLTPSVIERESL